MFSEAARRLLASSLLVVVHAAGSWATTLPDEGRIDYLDSLNPARKVVPMHGWSDQDAPSYDAFGDRDETVDIEGLRIELMGFRRDGRWTDCHARLASDAGHGRILALYRSSMRVGAWDLNPFGNSFRDSFSTRNVAAMSYWTTLVEATADADSALRLTLRAEASVDSRRGTFHQFVLVFRRDGAGYRLSHAEEQFDVLYDVALGTVSGAGELRRQEADGLVLERREIRGNPESLGECGRSDLARRLSKKLEKREDLRQLECLRARGRVLSRRLDRRPEELYDIASR